MVKRGFRLELVFPKLFPKLFSSVFIDPYVALTDSEELVYFSRYSILIKSYLNDFTAADHPYLLRRFELKYQLLSYIFNLRFNIQRRVYSRVKSTDNIFSSSNWLEREVWDMFGVKFISNTKEIRRILSDYGFQGFPLRKDFPVTGFFQIRYSEKKKRLIYFPVKVADFSLDSASNINNEWTFQ